MDELTRRLQEEISLTARLGEKLAESERMLENAWQAIEVKDEALQWYVNINRCENPIRKPLPNPEGYAENVELLNCGECRWCKAKKALED